MRACHPLQVHEEVEHLAFWGLGTRVSTPWCDPLAEPFPSGSGVPACGAATVSGVSHARLRWPRATFVPPWALPPGCWEPPSNLGNALHLGLAAGEDAATGGAPVGSAWGNREEPGREVDEAPGPAQLRCGRLTSGGLFNFPYFLDHSIPGLIPLGVCEN